MPELIVAKFTGDIANKHKLPAYEAAKSLYGISRTMLIVTNYLAEGRVRRRDFNPVGFELNIIAQRPGSFETVFEIASRPEAMVYGGLIVAMATLIPDLIASVSRRAVGQGALGSIKKLENSEQLPFGDVEALVDAVEPALRDAHRSVGYGARRISLQRNGNNIVEFDSATKDYINYSEVDTEIHAKLFSVGGFDANSGYGRVFDFDEGRTIPFQLMKDADRITIDCILNSMSSYTRKRRLGDELVSAVAFQYRTVVAQDGRVKKLLPIKVRQNLVSL
ncbi:DUF7946 domain-containing protein [Methylosinus sp. LW4]|uniref:DUF7946 domain-containing protein n=1 Tax=Methylosinus sp. LW4 TaxID=136993 RepID=UPI0012F95121|nr:hypothetical protein [Methylosinus sp. LW4]